MGRLKRSIRQIMASVLVVAMIMSNMAVYASEPDESAKKTENTVENADADDAGLSSTQDENEKAEVISDDTVSDKETKNETEQEEKQPQDKTTPEESFDSTESVDKEDASAQESEKASEEDASEEEESNSEEASAIAESDEESVDNSDDATHTVWIVGDSTVCSYIKDGKPTDYYYYPRYGYGTQIENYLDSTYTVQNLAVSGTSSKSFLSNSNYSTLTSGIQAGDMLVIGFGHNDEKAEEARYTNPNGTYTDEGSFAKSLYDNYVKIAKDKGAEVILCTPIVRRGTDKDESGNTKLSNSQKHITTASGSYAGGDYRQAIIALGEDVHVPVVDLTALTTALYEGMSPDDTLYFHAWTAGTGEDPDPGDPTSVDNTHLNIYGAKEVAWIFAKAINEAESESLLAKTEFARHITLDAGEPSKDKDLEKNPDYVKAPYTSPEEDSKIFTNKYVASDKVTFKGTAFGQLNGNPSTENFILETDAQGNMHVQVKNDKGKITSTEDGFLMYYYRLPADSQFKFSAKAKLTDISSHTQAAFGLMARDDMYIDSNISGLASDYVAAGSLGSSTNCFARRGGTLKKPALSAETITVDKSYDLQIESNTDGYACTFGKETTQTDGFDFKLTSVDSKYIYIGMFATRNADVTYSNIYLEVDGEVLVDQRKEEYNITVTADANGTATANETTAVKDSSITLTATPNEGYVLDHWEAQTASGTSFNVTNNTFAMPADDVTVKAVFAESKFDTATVAKGVKSFESADAELTGFEGITFANFQDQNNKHGFVSNTSSNPIMNLHMEPGKKAWITVTSCCYNTNPGNVEGLSSSSGVVTGKVIQEENKDSVQYNVLNIEDEYVTLTFESGMYIHQIEVGYVEEPKPGERKIDVWDFGAKEETNTELYNNNITYVEWLGYKSKIGSDGKFKEGGDYAFGDVTITGVLQNDRLYSNAAELSGMNAGTNYADKSVEGDDYKASGVYYCNGTGGAARRLLTIDNVQAGDKIVLYMGVSNGGSDDVVHFAGQGTASEQDETFTLSQTIEKHEFIAQYTGTYKIYAAASGAGKPIYYRLMRVPGVNVSGTVKLNGNELPAGYSLLFVNQTTNGETAATVSENADGEPAFTVSLAPGYTYKAALAGATGYGFTNASASFDVKNEQILTGKNDVVLVVEEKDTYDFSGKIKGFAADYARLDDLKIVMTPPATSSDDKIELNITKDAGGNLTFNSTLSPDVEYSLVLEGVNDYKLLAPEKVSKAADNNGVSYENRTITVAEKERYNVSGGFMGLSGNAEVTKLTFTNLDDNYVYDAAINSEKDGYSIELRDGEYLVNATVADYTTKTHVVVNGGAVSKDLMFVSTKAKDKIDLVQDIYVGYPEKENNYATVSAAMADCERMTRNAEKPERITVHIAPGTYREQIIVNAPNVTFVNGSTKGEEVLLTWYYGIGYHYYSSDSSGYYNAELAYDKYEKHIASRWGTAVYVKSTASGFQADGITFENSFNRYVTEEELADGVEPAGNEAITFVRNLTSDVTSKVATERATAIAIEGANAEFRNCGFYSSQDTLYTQATSYFKNCIIEGQTDYIFGSGNCVFDSCELSWKGYSIGTMGGYITANRPNAGELGYLFRNCTVTANVHNNLPVAAGDWGRPWGQEAKVIFMNTKLQTAGLITDKGWSDMSGATAAKATGFQEYKTTAMDGTEVTITNAARKAHVMSDADAAKVNAKTYFGSWTPEYFTEDAESTVSIVGDLSLSDNGDINYLLPGHTLTVSYTLNSDANTANDASIVRWYTVKYTNGTAGTPKLVKTANGALDKTYKISKDDIGSYIKVTVTPGTVSGKTGEMKELLLYKDGDIDHVVNDGYYDPTTGSSSSLGDGVNIFLAGDSTTKDYSENGMYNNGKADNLGSWGEFLQLFFDESEVKIQNYANGGRSTRSFINEGSLDKIKAQIGAGDYLFIQFAHNDSSAIASKKDVYVPLGEPDSNGIYPYTEGTMVNGKYPDYAVSAGSSASDNGIATYKWFLRQYVDMALEAKATPVLLTPVARMYVDDNTGKMKDHHIDEGSAKKEAFGYCKAVKQVYEDYKKDGKNVLFIDAYAITEKFYTDAWDETNKNTKNKQVMSLTDGTHSNKLGGLLTAAAYAQELQKLKVTVSSAVKAPSNVSALTVADVSHNITAGNTVFNIDAGGMLTAYDLTKNCSDRAPYWEGIGNTMFTEIKKAAGSMTEEGAVTAPTATPDPEAGDVESGTTVTLKCTTSGAKIYYTTDGTNPKVSDTKAEYVAGTTTITITKDTTIKAYAAKDQMTDSKIVAFNYTMAPPVKAPTSNVASGTAVKSGTKIELETATTTDGVQIRYTMGADPADPTKYSTRYNASNGIIINNDTTIKAIAVVGDDVSAVSTFTYTIDTTASTEKPAAPTADTPDGAVAIGKVVALSTTTQGALIYYTMGTDPMDPTASNADLYDAGDKIAITSSTKIKAVAIKDGVSSDVAVFEYTVPTTPTPVPDTEEGMIMKGAKVTLTVTAPADTTLNGLKIYYTTDRSNPKTSDTRTEVAADKAEITINADTTIKAYAVSTGLADSEVITLKYTLMAAPEPTADPDPDTPVVVGQKVTLSVNAPEGITLTGVKIHYTLDDSNPKNSDTTTTVEGSTVEITLENEITTIRAYASVEGCKDSEAVRFVYSTASKFVEEPVASPASGELKKGTTVHLSSATENAKIFYTTKLDADLDMTQVSTSDLTDLFMDDIEINENTVIYAYAKADGLKDSAIVKFVYTVKASIGEIVEGGSIEIVGLNEQYYYTGAAITPDFDVVDTGIIVDQKPQVLTLGVDYTVKYTDNKKLTKDNKNRKATVTIIGKGNYAGKEVKASFEIISTDISEVDPINVKGCKIEKIENRYFNGKAHYPEFTLVSKDKKTRTIYKYDTLKQHYVRDDGDYMDINVAISGNVNKGTATILVTGEVEKNKETSVKATFKILPVDLSKNGDQIKVSFADTVPYAVKGAKPEVTVSYTFEGDTQATVLEANKDYTVKYSNNRKAGATAKIVITGKGNYNKKADLSKNDNRDTFTVGKLDLGMDAKLVAADVYAGVKVTKLKAVVVDANDDVIKASEYDVKAFTDANGTTPYEGTNGKCVSGDSLYIQVAAKAKSQNVCSETQKGALLPVTVGNNFAKAKIKVTYTAEDGGKFKPYTGGEVELTRENLKVTLGTATVTLKPENDADMEEGKCYYEIVSYSNNINKGTATAVLQGYGACSGTKTIKFKIGTKAMKQANPVALTTNLISNIEMLLAN